ncbi:HD-GYP domain-containing protein [Paenibacillus sp. PK4536]|uniref:Cyclic di-GMP phosphodiesterase response regulator RpfG n=2 Tax=Paenibacillus TaxID=44249 RepID=A0A1E3KZ14_9BACL|nr:HD-GYP domain-containing protein [Paenibacillus sp. PK4536]ODP26581.1 Cyclic di-GMP phosphodiesterase response regulator RpfG [Paenibacillus nuruki]WIM40558.1 HD-GYP domain-containing protein [Paenibacillus sp. PK4536]
MRLIPVTSLQPGMRLAKKIYNDEGVVLLSVDAELTNGIIRKLHNHGLDYVYIQDADTDDIVVEDIITSETRRKALQEIQVGFRSLIDPQAQKKNYPLIGRSFSGVVDSILNDISTDPEVMIMLMNIHVKDQYLYHHSLNVCIYTLLLGKVHGYSTEELHVLGIGSLLHDIGKIRIPSSILSKPERLTDLEYEEIKLHTEYGFKMLKDEPGIPLLAAHCAYQHHERLNGSGYPRGITEPDIHDYAKWIAIADSYDALTTSRVYRSALLPHQALEVLYAGYGTMYDKYMMEIFKSRVAIYPIGLTVVLSNGLKGVVVHIHKSITQRPIIRILYNEAGERLASPYDLDLLAHHSIVIAGVEGLNTHMHT